MASPAPPNLPSIPTISTHASTQVFMLGAMKYQGTKESDTNVIVKIIGKSAITLAVDMVHYAADREISPGHLTHLRSLRVSKFNSCRWGQYYSNVSKTYYTKTNKPPHNATHIDLNHNIGKDPSTDMIRDRESTAGCLFDAYVGAVLMEHGFHAVLGWIKDIINAERNLEYEQIHL